MRNIIPFNYTLTPTNYTFMGDYIYNFRTFDNIEEGYYLAIVDNNFTRTGFSNSVIIYLIPRFGRFNTYYVLRIEGNNTLDTLNITHIIPIDYYDKKIIIDEPTDNLINLVEDYSLTINKLKNCLIEYYDFKEPKITFRAVANFNPLIKWNVDITLQTGTNSQGTYIYSLYGYFIPRFIVITAKSYNLETNLNYYFERSRDGINWDLDYNNSIKVSNVYTTYYIDIFYNSYIYKGYDYRLRIEQPNLIFGDIKLIYTDLDIYYLR